MKDDSVVFFLNFVLYLVTVTVITKRVEILKGERSYITWS